MEAAVVVVEVVVTGGLRGLEEGDGAGTFGQTTSIVAPLLSSSKKIVRVGNSSREMIMPARQMNWIGWLW